MAATVQSLAVRHVPQVPAPGPVSTHLGEAALRHGAAPPPPKSPVHATQVSFEHAEVVPVQLPCSVALHGPQRFVVVSQTWPAEQSLSLTQPPH